MSTKETKKKVSPLLEDEAPKKGAKKAPVIEPVEEIEEITEEEVEEVVTPKKVTTSKAPVNTDAGLLSDIKLTELKLSKEQKVMFMVPLAEGEKKGSVHQCFINGYQFNVPKGVMTEVPMSIAQMLAESYKIGMEAGSDFRIDTNTDKLDALA